MRVKMNIYTHTNCLISRSKYTHTHFLNFEQLNVWGSIHPINWRLIVMRAMHINSNEVTCGSCGHFVILLKEIKPNEKNLNLN